MENKNRKSIRLKGYDYSKEGDYFITICTQNRECLFGEFMDGKMILNDIGKIAERCYLEIPKHFPNVELDIFQIMPNHIHFIICIVGAENFLPIKNELNIRADDYLPLQERCHRFQKPVPKSIASIVKGFKIGVTKLCNQNELGFQWQRGYYEHIILNEKSYGEIYNYIESNVSKWDEDRNNPKNEK